MLGPGQGLAEDAAEQRSILYDDENEGTIKKRKRV